MNSERSIVIRYGVAAVSGAAAFGLAMALSDAKLMPPFTLFYAAVALTSWYGGTGPGLVIVAFAAVVVPYLVLEPLHTLGASRPLVVGRLVLFVLVGTLIAVLNGQLLHAKRRLQAEAEAARIGEARAKRLAESNLIAVFFCDRDGMITWGNDAFLELVGWDLEGLRGARVNWGDLTAPEHRHLDDRAREELKQTRVCKPFEKDQVHRNGRRIPVMMGCALLEGPGDDCVGFLIDLTQRKQAEAEIRAHQARLNALASELMRAEERERRRIAVVLHDSISATLALAKRKIEAVKGSAASAGDVGRLDEVLRLISDTIQRSRSLTSEVSPPVLYELGLTPALRWLCDRVQQEHGIACDVDDDGQRMPMADEVRLVLFQAVRELLTNAVKHAGAKSCQVTVRRDSRMITIEVKDDGCGFDPAQRGYTSSQGDGFGLFNIRERLAHLGGRFGIDSKPGAGTKVTLAAPWKRAGADHGGNET